MSNGRAPLAERVTRRIRTLTRIAWAVGGLVGLWVVWTGLDDLRFVGGGRLVVDDGFVAGGSPWDEADPHELEVEAGGTIRGPAGGSVLRIPAAERPDGAVALFAGNGVSYLDFDQTPEGAVDFDAPPEARERPVRRGWIDSEQPGIVLPGEGDLELWFESDEPWRLTMQELPTTDLDAVYNGKGDAYLYYDGDRLSARAEHIGDGTFYVRWFTPNEYDFPVIESGPVDTHFSWSYPGPVLIAIESDASRGAWTVSVDGETPAPTDPAASPAPTAPAPTDTADTDTADTETRD